MTDGPNYYSLAFWIVLGLLNVAYGVVELRRMRRSRLEHEALMRKGRPLLLAVVALLGCVAVASAGSPCVAVAPAAQVVTYQAAYAVPVLPAVFVPTPSYTVGLSYQDGGKLDAILQRLDAMEAARPAAAVAPSESAVAVLTASCVRCHAAGVADDRGAGYAFDPANLSAEQKRQVLASVLSGAMPKGGPLPEAGRAALLRDLVK